MEAEPTTNFAPNIKKLFKTCDENTDKLQSILETELDDFKDLIQKSGLYEHLFKAIRLFDLAAKERKFTLTPLIARFNERSHEIHQLYRLLQNEKEFNHVFVNPIYIVTNLIYVYNLYIPIPKDLLELEDPKKLLKEHWNLVVDSIPPNLLNQAMIEFRPLYTASRVYGWDGAWLVYSVSVIDKGDFWSPPLVRSPYNGIQPVLAVKSGEFAILEYDETDSSKAKIDSVVHEISRRVRNNQFITFEESKSIEVAPEWLAASAFNKNSGIPLGMQLKEVSRNFGGKLAQASIDAKCPDSASKLIEFMKRETFGRPLHEFTSEEIKNCKIQKKGLRFDNV